MRQFDGITDSTDMNLSKLQETEDREAWCATIHEFTKSQTRLSNEQQLQVIEDLYHKIQVLQLILEEKGAKRRSSEDQNYRREKCFRQWEWN